MPIGSIIAAIIAGAVAIGTTVGGGVAKTSATAKAQAEAKDMWENDQKKKDDRDARNHRLKKLDLQLDQEQLGFEMAKDRKDRRMKKEAIQYKKQERQYNKGVDLLNQSTSLRNNYIKQFKG